MMAGRRRGGAFPGQVMPTGPAKPRPPPVPAIESPADRWTRLPAQPTRRVPITENVYDEKIDAHISERPRGEVVEIVRRPKKVENLRLSRLLIGRAQAELLRLLRERKER